MKHDYNKSCTGSFTSSNNVDISNTAAVMNLCKETGREIGKEIGKSLRREMDKLENTRKNIENTWSL